jgi:hypothetical protein
MWGMDQGTSGEAAVLSGQLCSVFDRRRRLGAAAPVRARRVWHARDQAFKSLASRTLAASRSTRSPKIARSGQPCRARGALAACHADAHHANSGEQHGEDEVAKLALLGVAGGRGAGCHDDASERHQQHRQRPQRPGRPARRAPPLAVGPQWPASRGHPATLAAISSMPLIRSGVARSCGGEYRPRPFRERYEQHARCPVRLSDLGRALGDIWRMAQGTTTVISGPQRSIPIHRMTRADCVTSMA